MMRAASWRRWPRPSAISWSRRSHWACWTSTYAANLLIKQHGDGATANARKRSAELAAMGEPEGAEAYLRIAAAMIALLDSPSAALH